ncbi:MAG TPA: hypothetical protein VF616_30360 [Duganella sp.]|uniref:hypothetical protein n=1 Tax=Duganella sp. TaxID=1904440 RepID=UPI002ED4731B
MASYWRGAGIVLLAAACYAAGAITAGVKHWFQPLVYVSIENDSGEDLAKLVLTHESASLTSTVTLPALKRGQSTELIFFVAGEGGYQIEALFPDGRMAKSGAGYVESGSSIKEVIGKPKTVTDADH